MPGNANKDDHRMELPYNVWRSEADGILSAYSDLSPEARSQFDSAHGSRWLHAFLFVRDTGRQIGVDLLRRSATCCHHDQQRPHRRPLPEDDDLRRRLAGDPPLSDLLSTPAGADNASSVPRAFD